MPYGAKVKINGEEYFLEDVLEVPVSRDTDEVKHILVLKRDRASVDVEEIDWNDVSSFEVIDNHLILQGFSSRKGDDIDVLLAA